MMDTIASRGPRVRRAVGIAVGLALWVLPATFVKAADDAGIGAFFRQQFGIGEPSPAPTYSEPADRPLVVRRHRRVVQKNGEARKVAVGPTVPVSIYDDKTLRAGDAVMTAKGLRIFVGGGAAPFSDSDFVAVSNVSGLPKQVEKALVEIDKAPHG